MRLKIALLPRIMTLERKAQNLSDAIDGAPAGDDAEMQELLDVARLREALGATRRAEAERHREQVWQRLNAILSDK